MSSFPIATHPWPYVVTTTVVTPLLYFIVKQGYKVKSESTIIGVSI